jgi:spore coat protein SA
LNIFIIAPPRYTVSPSTGSSVEISIYQIAKRIAKHHKVTIFSRKVGNLPATSRHGNLTIVRVLERDNYLNKAIRYARKYKFDYIQVENRPHYILRLKRYFPRTPLILVLHSFTFLNLLSEQVKRSVLRKADTIICNSHFIMQSYMQEFPKYAAKFHMIYLGVDTNRFTPPPVQKNTMLLCHSLSNSFNVLYAGRVIPRKGVSILIQAVGHVRKKHPFVKLIIVGPCLSKDYKAKLLALAKQEKVPVHFFNKIKPSSMHRVYRLGNCFVCPTQFPEAFGLVNVEAMSNGLPVIASRRGGIPEIIDETSGILVDDYKNPQAFAFAIEQIIASPLLADSLAKKGREVVLQKFDWDMTASRYHDFYTTCS